MLRLVSSHQVQMLCKMASSGVAIWENPSESLWLLWIGVFFFYSQQWSLILPMVYNTGVTSLSYIGFLFHLLCLIPHLSALFILGACGSLITQPGSTCQTWRMQLVGEGEASLGFKREQMMREMLWLFPPQIRLPILHAPCSYYSPLIPAQPVPPLPGL